MERVSPSNPLAIEAAARVRRSHVTSFAKFPTSKQAKSKADRTSAQCHALQALQLAHGADLLGLDRARKSFAHVPRAVISEGVFYVYVLRSESDGGFYIGYSSNLRIRLWQHQDGRSRATSYRGPWRLIYYETYLHQADALGGKKYLKSGGGRRFLKAQLRHYLAEGSPNKPRRRAVA